MTVALVLIMVAGFLLADWLLHRRQRARTGAPAAADVDVVRLPQGVFFAPSHTWLSLLPSGRAWLGLDDFVSRLLAEPQVEVLKLPGSRVKRGEPLLWVRDGGRGLTVRSPIDAAVVGVNPEIGRPGALRSPAPFCERWACELEPERGSDLKALLLGEEARAWMQSEFRRLRDLLAAAGPALSPAALQDGGPPIAGALRDSDHDTWTRFEREFLEVTP
jgi:glycine cleavage system H lipoate-binding protein